MGKTVEDKKEGMKSIEKAIETNKDESLVFVEQELERYKAEILAKKKCSKEIEEILIKYNARLIVDPNSRVSKMHIMVVLNNNY